MSYEARVQQIISTDTRRWQLLDVVRRLDLPDCWIGAGFVRNAVWDHLHERRPSPLTGDVDVIWFDPDRADHGEDQRLEAALRTLAPGIDWSVKNQARMHSRNGDSPYGSSAQAMSFWCETATAIAVRRTAAGVCEVSAPLGLDDLFELLLRPSRRFVVDKRQVYEERIAAKAWLSKWPKLRCVG
ncbi:nucleotidyltransferase family protein [Pseudomonas rubra]|uniref:Nucleotidyltransferase family protein n=1 Tax=Pseudomonas rubra TaxID=2942627 RepID=A0ABT5P9I5_9PSED|nr:nucleotidyltransferase family protein [Pseudomonas rubra]MDD1014967.1 nucleotidyltransferase family protein [Pseudomonas rubra]MDD1038088.1 nucleotidyltransferase family protein [Pseudomonas rubra]MDD1156601.1 nucleotidyltransferase family protein [Pseudomonas rubra]